MDILDFNGFNGIELPMADTVKMWRRVVCRNRNNKNLNENEGNILYNLGSSSRRR